MGQGDGSLEYRRSVGNTFELGHYAKGVEGENGGSVRSWDHRLGAFRSEASVLLSVIYSQEAWTAANARLCDPPQHAILSGNENAYGRAVSSN